MGVHDFTKIFRSVRTVNLKDTAGQDYAVDAYPEIFRGRSMQYAGRLTNPQGEPTMHLKVTLNNIIARQLAGGDDVWCFDSRDPREQDDPKQKTLATRAAVRASNMEEVKRVDENVTRMREMRDRTPRETLLRVEPDFDRKLTALEDELEVLRARNPDSQHFGKLVTDVQFMLEKLGIRYAVASAGVDAEHLAAQLCREDVVDGVISTDTDCIAYGAPCQLKKVRSNVVTTDAKTGERRVAKRAGMYDVYTLDACLQEHKLTYPQLVSVCTAMGTDFCKKTPGVGAATVVQRVKSDRVTFTDEQLAAQAKFMDRTDVKYEYFEPVRTDASVRELRDWLVDVQGFGAADLDRRLAPFRSDYKPKVAAKSKNKKTTGK